MKRKKAELMRQLTAHLTGPARESDEPLSEALSCWFMDAVLRESAVLSAVRHVTVTQPVGQLYAQETARSLRPVDPEIGGLTNLYGLVHDYQILRAGIGLQVLPRVLPANESDTVPDDLRHIVLPGLAGNIEDLCLNGVRDAAGAEEFSEERRYETGDLTLRDGVLCRFVRPRLPGEWRSSDVLLLAHKDDIEFLAQMNGWLWQIANAGFVIDVNAPSFRWDGHITEDFFWHILETAPSNCIRSTHVAWIMAPGIMRRYQRDIWKHAGAGSAALGQRLHMPAGIPAFVSEYMPDDMILLGDLRSLWLVNMPDVSLAKYSLPSFSDGIIWTYEICLSLGAALGPAMDKEPCLVMGIAERE